MEQISLKSFRFVRSVLTRHAQLIAFALFAANGCAGAYRHTIEFNPTEPLRVAVLPFVQVDDNGNVLQVEDAHLLVDNVPLVSSKLKERPAELVQRLVQNQLSKSGLDLLSPVLVERRLSHSSFRDERGAGFNTAAVQKASPKELCELLSCDAVLYGKVTKWDRDYYVAQSVNTVGITLRLVSADSGKVLFSSEGEDSDSRGLTKGPTGFSSLVLEPIRGLDSAIIEELSEHVVMKMLNPLYVQNRPDFLKQPPPSIFASAHDAESGHISKAGAASGRAKPLVVLASGSPGLTASFSIGSVIENVPMVEKDKGHYIGEFYPLPSDSFTNEMVVVSLTDSVGRTTVQKIGRGPVSITN